MKRLLRGAVIAAVGLVLAHPVFAGPLKLEFKDGRVTLDAQDVPAAQILAEWARVGQTKVVNGDKLTGGPLTLQFNGVPEKEALDVVLRAAAGYMAAPRATTAGTPSVSVYDRIVVLASSRPAPSTVPAVAGAGSGAPQPIVPRMPGPGGTGTVDDQDQPVPGPGQYASPMMPGQPMPNQPMAQPAGQPMYQPGMMPQPFGMPTAPNQQGPTGNPTTPYTSPTTPPNPGQAVPQPNAMPGTSPVPGVVPQKVPPKGPGGNPGGA